MIFVQRQVRDVLSSKIEHALILNRIPTQIIFCISLETIHSNMHAKRKEERIIQEK